MSNNSILKSTGQSWKITLFYIGVLVGGAIMFLGLFVLDRNIVGFLTAVGGMAVGMVSFVFVIMSIRCPVCGVRWGWLSVRQKPLNEWLPWLTHLYKCPKCLCTENDLKSEKR